MVQNVPSRASVFLGPLPLAEGNRLREQKHFQSPGLGLVLGQYDVAVEVKVPHMCRWDALPACYAAEQALPQAIHVLLAFDVVDLGRQVNNPVEGQMQLVRGFPQSRSVDCHRMQQQRVFEYPLHRLQRQGQGVSEVLGAHASGGEGRGGAYLNEIRLNLESGIALLHVGGNVHVDTAPDF